MKKTCFVLLLVVVAGLSQADLRSEFLAARNKQEKAALNKDFKAAEAAMKESITSDFKYIQAGKAQDAKTYMGEFMETLKMMEHIDQSGTRVISLKETGSKGAGEIELSMKGTMTGPDKKPHAIDWTGRFKEEFRKVGGKWKLAVMTQGKQKFLMDGKPVKM